MSYLLNNPFFGIGLSILVYGIGEYLYHKTNRFVLFQPLFFGMLLGIGLLVLIASILKAPVQKFMKRTRLVATGYSGLWRPPPSRLRCHYISVMISLRNIGMSL
ncbi:murein hydrolase regulator [Lactiplantibacillus plantarum subsp. plantarum]|nr:murein hydrolase regulator [Lactiplantibacillus plantarum subsp. plantarum]